MTVDEIVAQLSVQQSRQPVEVYEAAEAVRPELTERFLAELERMVEDPQAHLEQSEGVLSSYALYFLGKWREPRAYPLLVRLARLPEALLLELTGDIFPLHGALLLASAQNGDITAIQELIEDPKVADFIRAQAILALAVLVAWEERTRQEVADYYGKLFQGGLQPEGRSQAWTSLVTSAVNLEAWPLLPEIHRVLEAGWVDEQVVDKTAVQNARSAPPGATLSVFASRFPPITDIAEMTRWWTCFAESASPGKGRSDEPDPAEAGELDIGRNDPCPCGSGLKYKKCCGKNA